jgi:hypothetical protein
MTKCCIQHVKFWVDRVFRRWGLVEGRWFIDTMPLTGDGEIPALPSRNPFFVHVYSKWLLFNGTGNCNKGTLLIPMLT